MPLSKARQAKWMREYRANKRELGITTNKSRCMGNSVIPKLLIKPTIDQFNEGYALFGKPELDADGNQIYEE